MISMEKNKFSRYSNNALRQQRQTSQKEINEQYVYKALLTGFNDAYILMLQITNLTAII